VTWTVLPCGRIATPRISDDATTLGNIVLLNVSNEIKVGRGSSAVTVRAGFWRGAWAVVFSAHVSACVKGSFSLCRGYLAAW
jgi:hypothetical protein